MSTDRQTNVEVDGLDAAEAIAGGPGTSHAGSKAVKSRGKTTESARIGTESIAGPKKIGVVHTVLLLRIEKRMSRWMGLQHIEYMEARK